MSGAYYNENDPMAADWLRWLIREGLIADGEVDDRSIGLVQPDDLRGFTQVHFFAGIGGWSLAARLAGWPDERPLWTGSCPCQPFSPAGRREGANDPRHLWPDFFRLIDACRPAIVLGEQVAGSAGEDWFDGVRADLGGASYASRGIDIPAAAVDSPQIRQRLWWLGASEFGAGPGRLADCKILGGGAGLREDGAISDGAQPADRDGHGGGGRGLACPEGVGLGGRGLEPVWSPIGRTAPAGDDAGERGGGLGGSDEQSHEQFPGELPAAQGQTRDRRADGASAPDESYRGDHLGGPARWGLAVRIDATGERGYSGRRGDASRADERNGSWWADHRWIVCHDKKIRRVPEPAIPLLAHGFPGRVVAWSGLGNAINPRLAAEVIGATMDEYPAW